MTASRIDWSFAFRSLLVAGGICLLVTLVHSWQMRRHAAAQLAMADRAEREDDPEASIAALNRYLSFDPGQGDVRARYALALAARASGPRDQWRALQVLRQAMSQVPLDATVRLRAAELALALDEPGQALRDLSPLLERPDAGPEVHLLAAHCELARNRPQAAAESFEAVLRLAPDRVAAAESLAAVYRDRLGQPRLAVAVLNQLVRDNPRLAAAHRARARHAIGDLRLEAAADDLEVAAALAPADVEVARTQAEVETLRGRADQACQAWRRAIKFAPGRVDLSLALARAERKRGEPARAIEVLRQAQGREPDHPEVVFDLAELLLDGGQGVEAAALQRRLGPSAAGRSRYLDARRAQRERRWLDAVHAYIAALGCADVAGERAGHAYLELSRCYAVLGGEHEEMQSLESAVRLSADPASGLALAERLIQRRQFDRALPVLRDLGRLPAASPRVWAVLAGVLVEQNRLLPAPQRRWEEIEQALDRAASDPGQGATVAVVRANLFALRGDPAAARAALETAIKRHPLEPALYLTLADLAIGLGDEEAGRAALERGDRALANRPEWLGRRIDRAVVHAGSGGRRDLAGLEGRVEALAGSDRGRLERRLVEAHARLGNHRDVQRLCVQLLTHRDDAQLRLGLIESLLAQNDLVEARRQITQLRRHEGEAGLGWRCARAEWLTRQAGPGDAAALAEARGLLDHVRQARPGWPRPAYLLARLDDREGRTEAALQGYRRVLELGDYRLTVLNRTLEILDGRKRWAEALAVCEQALRLGALDRATQRVAANLAIKANQKARARELATLLVPEDGTAYRDQIWLGGVLDAADRPSAAREALGRAVALAPDAVEPYLALIAHHARHREGAEAAEVVERLKAAVGGPRGALAVARAYELMARPEMAERSYRDFLKRQPRDVDALSRLARLLERYDRPVEAQAVLARLLDPRVAVPDEDVPNLRRRLALALTAPEQTQDRVDDALRLLERNRQEYGDDPADERTRALVAGRRAGQRTAAIEALERLPAGTLSPGEVLRLARLHDAAGDERRARSGLIELIDRDPGNAGALAVLIDVLLRQQRPGEAREWIERLDRLEPGSSRVAALRRRWAELDRTSPGR